MTDHLPDAKVMICGGHAGRTHKKQMEKLQKMKSFIADLIRKYIDIFPTVGDVVYHCSRHKQGCGRLSKTSKLPFVDFVEERICQRICNQK